MAKRKMGGRGRTGTGGHGLKAMLEALFQLMHGIAERGSARQLEEIINRLGLPDGFAALGSGFGAAALVLATDLNLFTAPPGRSTALERFAKQARFSAGSPEATVLAAMLRQRFTLFDITGVGTDGHHDARDVLSGDEFRLITLGMERIAEPGTRLAGRLVPLTDCRVLIGGAVLLRDEDMAHVQRWLSRDGKTIANPGRCADALYGRAIGEARVVLPGVFNGDLSVPDFDRLFVDEDDIFQTIASEWATNPSRPSPESDGRIRSLTSIDDMITVLQYLRVARMDRDSARAAAFERMAVMQLETLHRRVAIGTAGADETVQIFAAEIERAIEAGEIPSIYRDMFRELDAKARQAAGRQSAEAERAQGERDGGRDADLDKLLARIRALRAKTVEQGCTEEEAMAAAAKVAELLDRHGLSLSELELRQQVCEGNSVATGRRRRAPIDECVGTVAHFCDCRTWYETTNDGEIRFMFFGLPADVAAARCLYDLIDAAVDSQTAVFKAGPLYAEHHSRERASATRSFQIGMVQSIRGKLYDLKTQRSQTTLSATGRDLVPVKADIVAEELARLGMRFTAKARSSSRSVLSDAFQAGRVAGEGFEFEPKVNSDKAA